MTVLRCDVQKPKLGGTQMNVQELCTAVCKTALQVFFGIPFKQGDVILTSQAEYGSNYLAYLQVRGSMCAAVTRMPAASHTAVLCRRAHVQLQDASPSSSQWQGTFFLTKTSQPPPGSRRWLHTFIEVCGVACTTPVCVASAGLNCCTLLYPGPETVRGGHSGHP